LDLSRSETQDPLGHRAQVHRRSSHKRKSVVVRSLASIHSYSGRSPGRRFAESGVTPKECLPGVADEGNSRAPTGNEVSRPPRNGVAVPLERNFSRGHVDGIASS
jgi:hypothetical protein